MNGWILSSSFSSLPLHPIITASLSHQAMLYNRFCTATIALLLLAAALPTAIASVPLCKGPDVPEDRRIPIYNLQPGATNAPHVGKSYYELWNGSNGQGIPFHAEYDFDDQLLTLTTQTNQNDKFRFYRVTDVNGIVQDYVVQDSQSCQISMKKTFKADSHLARVTVHTMQFTG